MISALFIIITFKNDFPEVLDDLLSKMYKILIVVVLLKHLPYCARPNFLVFCGCVTCIIKLFLNYSVGVPRYRKNVLRYNAIFFHCIAIYCVILLSLYFQKNPVNFSIFVKKLNHT